jgi:CheY-like chemotaxis protein
VAAAPSDDMPGGNEELKMAEARGASGPIRKLLIADDDPGISRFLARQCSKMGFDVQTAKNGLEALIMLRQHRPDVLIVDINMPEVDGLTVCTRMLKSYKRSNGVIVITAGLYSGTVERCKSLGAFHVRKGIDLWNGVRSALIELYSDLAQDGGSDADSAIEMRRLPRVLLVGGDPEARSFLSSKLSECGIETVLANDAFQACKIAQWAEPSVIITDYPLPAGDAHYLLRRLRNAPATHGIPVFVWSASPLSDSAKVDLTQEVGGRAGAVEFFEKSFKTEELFAALQKFCAFATDPNLREDSGRLTSLNSVGEQPDKG